jgi:hypothetical protein
VTYRFDEFQKFGTVNIEAITKSSSSLAKGWQAIAAETADYARKSFDNGSDFFGKLLGAKSFDEILQLRSEYAKSSFDRLADYVSKVGNLYSNVAKDAFKPVGGDSEAQNFSE